MTCLSGLPGLPGLPFVIPVSRHFSSSQHFLFSPFQDTFCCSFFCFSDTFHVLLFQDAFYCLIFQDIFVFSYFQTLFVFFRFYTLFVFSYFYTLFVFSYFQTLFQISYMNDLDVKLPYYQPYYHYGALNDLDAKPSHHIINTGCRITFCDVPIAKYISLFPRIAFSVQEAYILQSG